MRSTSERKHCTSTPEDRGGEGATCLHVRFLPGEASSDVETGGARLFSFLPAKGQGDVMPLQMMEMRL